MKNKELELVAKVLVNKLNEHDLGSYFWYQSEWGSCYITFYDKWMPTILVGNGIKNERKTYMFTMRKDIKTITKELDISYSIWRVHVPMWEYKDLVDELIKSKHKFKRLSLKK